jgi:hypothetical protein
LSLDSGSWSWADQAIGVYTGDNNVPLRVGHDSVKELVKEAFVTAGEDTRPPPMTKGDYVPEPKKRGRRKGHVFHRADNQPLTTVRPIIEQIINFLNERQAVGAGELRQLTGIEKGHKHYWRLRDAVRWLTVQQILDAKGGTISRVYTKGPLYPADGILRYAP